MKFSDLDDFVNNQMNLQGEDKNFQQVVISTLIQNGGKATIEELKEQVLKYHPGHNFDIGHASIGIITNPIIRKTKDLYPDQTIAKRTKDTIELLDYDTYTIKQKAKIIVDCILKIPEKKEYLEDSIDFCKYQISMQPELESQKKEVLDKYGKSFNLKNIDKLTAKTYQDFLLYKNNYHWQGLERNTTNATSDMNKLKKTLKILVDESIPIEVRYEKVRTSKTSIGVATFTPILLVVTKMKYAVVNGKITNNDDGGALNKLGLINAKQSKKMGENQAIVLVQKMIEYISELYQLDLWQIDWVWFDMNLKKQPDEKPRYWLVMPGSGSSHKDKWISEGYCAIGYADLFLPRYFGCDGEPERPRKKDLRTELKKQLTNREKQQAKEQKRKTEQITEQKVSKKLIPLGQFMSIAKNDVVILWNGVDKIFARAIVGNGHYEYKNDQVDPHLHRRKVIWTKDERDIPSGIHNIPTNGIYPLYGEEGRANHKFFKWLMGDSITTMSTTPNNYQEDLALLKWEKNLILYGPPGTGKTFHAGRIADEFLKDNIQPTWLTCAAMILTEHGGTPMPYKEITNLILEAKLKVFSTAATPEETVSRDIREDIEINTDSFFKQEVRGSYGLDTPMTFIKGIRLILTCFGEQHYEKITKTLLDNNIVQSDGVTPEKTALAVITEDISRNGVNSTFVTTNTSGVYNLRKPSLHTVDYYKNNITFHQSYSYEEFIEGIKAKVEKDESDPKSIKRYVNYVTEPGIFQKFCSRAESDPDPENNYVMIIDEINRGNISKIFGELITVIEKDKRGKSVTLPYSGEPFSVPENVYVIGTMNTADRSIAKIDTALTRRFGRREIMPDSSVLKNHSVQGINLTKLLDKLNEKIVNRDRHIGHSYLMNGDSAIDNISDLRLAFLYDIIPLLKELTFDEEDGLDAIIGKYFIDDKTKTVKEDLTKTNEAFLKEMKSFLNSNPQKNDSKDTDGDVTDVQDS